MRSTLLTVAVWLFPTIAFCQADDPIYRFPAPVSWPIPLLGPDFLFTQHHASTAGEGYLRGSAAWIHAWGNFHVNRQQAAILYQQASYLELLNKHSLAEWNDWKRLRHQKKVDAKRKQNLERRVACFQKAYELNNAELDRATGEIHWPLALQGSEYDSRRDRLEELYRHQAGYDRPTPSDARAIQAECDRLIRESNRNRTRIASGDHSAAQRFLRGLKYEPLFRLQVN